MDCIKLYEILTQILDFFLNRYGVFCLAVCTFLFPIVLFMKCKYEEKVNQKFRNRAITNLLNDDSQRPPVKPGA